MRPFALVLLSLAVACRLHEGSRTGTDTCQAGEDELPSGARARLGTSRWRHGHTVASVSFSPDGGTLASGSLDGTLALWEVPTGKRRTLLVRDEPVSHVAFAPRGDALAFTTRNMAGIYKADPSLPPMSFDETAGATSSVTWSPDGAVILGCGRDGAVRTWDPKTGRTLQRFQGFKGNVYDAAFSTDGKRVAAAGFDSAIRLWNTADGASIRVLVGHTDVVLSVAFSPDGRTLASAGNDGSVRLWNLETGLPQKVIAADQGLVYGCRYSPDGRFLAYTRGTSIQLWDVSAEKQAGSFDGHSGWVVSIAFSADAKLLASGAMDATIRLWDLSAAKPAPRPGGHEGPVTSIWATGGPTLVSTSEDLTIRLWDTRRFLQEGVFGSHARPASAAVLSRDHRTLYSVSHEAKVRSTDSSTGKPLPSLDIGGGDLGCLSISPSGDQLSAGGGEGIVYQWKLPDRTLDRKLTGHRDRILYLSYSRDGTLLGSGGEDGTFRLWQTDSGREVLLLRAGGPAQCGAISPDANLVALAAGESRSIIRLHSAVTGDERLILSGHADTVTALVFLSQGYLASASLDKTVRIWELASGSEVMTFRGHLGRVLCLSGFLEDHLIAAGGSDTSILVWQVYPNAAEGKIRSPRDFENEWEALQGDNPGRAHASVGRFICSGEPAVEFIRGKLDLTKDAREAARTLIPQLDNNEVDERERAESRLLLLGVESILEEALAQNPSPESKQRMLSILRSQRALKIRSPQILRGFRSVHILERIASRGAQDLLDELSRSVVERTAACAREALKELKRARR